jgi:hypothetical protein
MPQFATIKDLVIETCVAEGQFPSYDKLTAIVRSHFPTSKWQKSHYSWYKSQIKRGEIDVPGISFPEWPAPGEELETDLDVEERFDAAISVERDLHHYLASRVAELEAGLQLVEDGIEYQTAAGRVDLLARDSRGDLVVIELKAGKAKDSALGQLLGYIGCMAESEEHVRGILVANAFDNRVVFAVRALPQIKLVQYKLSFALEEVR